MTKEEQEQIIRPLSNVIAKLNSYMEDAKLEVRIRKDNIGGMGVFTTSLPISYWMGRESLSHEVMADLKRTQVEIEELIKKFVV